MLDPISAGIIGLSLVTLTLILKAWSREAGAMRLEIVKVDAQRKDRDMSDDLDLAIKDAEEARKTAQRAEELVQRMESRVNAIDNRTRRG